MNITYAEMLRHRRKGTVGKAAGPCTIKGCRSCGCGVLNCEISHRVFNYDHCHKHGYIRGVVCSSCNGKMRLFDRLMETRQFERIPVRKWRAPPSSYFKHWEKCPDCELEITGDDMLRVFDAFSERYSKALGYRKISLRYWKRERVIRRRKKRIRNAHENGESVRGWRH